MNSTSHEPQMVTPLKILEAIAELRRLRPSVVSVSDNQRFCHNLDALEKHITWHLAIGGPCTDTKFEIFGRYIVDANGIYHIDAKALYDHNVARKTGQSLLALDC